MDKIIEASLLAFDKKKIEAQVDEIKKAGIDTIHYDVMDGKFVPNVAFDVEYIDMLKKKGMNVNVHFMVKDPLAYAKRFLKHKVDAITFHPEGLKKFKLWMTKAYIKHKDVKWGLAFKPETRLDKYIHLITKCDYVTLMGVEPGAGGQAFKHESLDNLRLVYEIKKSLNKKLVIQFDGGVNFEVMKLIGPYTNNFISGSFLMKYPKNKSDVVKYLKKV